MKTIFLYAFPLLITPCFSFGQDTFSIVAVDSITGEVGSAGASCVDLFAAGLPNDDFLGVLVPGVGAINTQAYYLAANQNNATNQMNLGLSPSDIIQWLVANDVQGNPAIRQYGIAAMFNGSPETAAHTGASTNDYKNHIVGPNYSIQGNILLGQEVLDSMESRFLNEEGDLACKLMAALQGANMVGADTRCASDGTSSLFAFVKVSQPTDAFGAPSFLASVRTHNNSGIEPIDSLQIKFDLVYQCGDAGQSEMNDFDLHFNVYPTPTNDFLHIESSSIVNEKCEFIIYGIDGGKILNGDFTGDTSIDISRLRSGSYLLKIIGPNKTFTTRINRQ